MAPWVARNYSISGKPFGTATYAVVETSMLYPESRLQRSLEPDFSRLYLMAFWLKLNTNLRQILTSELPSSAGVGLRRSSLSGCCLVSATPPSRDCATSCWGASWC